MNRLAKIRLNPGKRRSKEPQVARRKRRPIGESHHQRLAYLRLSRSSARPSLVRIMIFRSRGFWQISWASTNLKPLGFHHGGH